MAYVARYVALLVSFFLDIRGEECAWLSALPVLEEIDMYPEHANVKFLQVASSNATMTDEHPALKASLSTGTAISLGLIAVVVGVLVLCFYAAALHIRARMRDEGSTPPNVMWHDGVPASTRTNASLVMPQTRKIQAPQPMTQSSQINLHVDTPPLRSTQHLPAHDDELPLDAPPPICPNLVMPYMEARFHMDLQELFECSTGLYSIVGMSGRPLLNMKLTEVTLHSFRFTLASIGLDEPRVTVIAPCPGQNSEGLPPLEVYAKCMHLYGTMKIFEEERTGTLSVESRPVLKVSVPSLSNMIIEAHNAAGAPIAWTHCLTRQQKKP